MMRKPLSRRTVLGGLGTAISLPLLEAMLPVGRAAAAKGADLPTRMMFLMVPNGAHMPAWTPATTGPDYQLTPTLEALSKHRKYVSVLSGLTLDGARAHQDGAGDHARSGASFLTGCHPRKTDGADIQNDVSVDQIASESMGKQTRFASLQLGLQGSATSGQCDSGYSCAYVSNLSWRSKTSPLSHERDPSAVFDRLFGTGDSKVSEGQVRSARLEKRKSVLDYALEDAKRLQSQLGSADKRKLDEYLYAVRDVETRMLTSDRLKVGENGIPNIARPAGIPRDWSEHCKLMMDMAALALRSDSTRVLTFMFAREGDNDPYPQIGVPEGHHDLSHHGKSAEKQEKIQKINTYHVQHLAYLVDNLAGVEEAGGSFLDNSMIVYGSGISDGDRHNHDDLPILMIGKAGGKIRKASHWQFAKDTPLCNLYLWMLNNAGVITNKFGDSTGQLEFS
jgi:hypothetical protein